MRRKLVARPILVFVVCAALALVGCSKKEEGGSAAACGGAETVSVAFVPKIPGVPYFEAMNAGGQKAAAELGNEIDEFVTPALRSKSANSNSGTDTDRPRRRRRRRTRRRSRRSSNT